MTAWDQLDAADQALFTDVTQQAAARASAEILQREAELVGEFRARGLGVHEVDRDSFRDAVLRTRSVASLGYDPRDHERILAIR